MLFQIDPRSPVPIWEQIVNQIKELVLKGILLPGDKIFSVRELASNLVINPNTVSKAYQELERQGIIETFRGRGTFIRQNVNIIKDEEKIKHLQEKIKQLVIEGTYLGIKTETLIQWIQDIEQELGRDIHDPS